MQPGDVPCTYADVDDLIKDVGFKPSTPIDEGLHFVNWYREYYKEKHRHRSGTKSRLEHARCSLTSSAALAYV